MVTTWYLEPHLLLYLLTSHLHILILAFKGVMDVTGEIKVSRVSSRRWLLLPMVVTMKLWTSPPTLLIAIRLFLQGWHINRGREVLSFTTMVTTPTHLMLI